LIELDLRGVEVTDYRPDCLVTQLVSPPAEFAVCVVEEPRFEVSKGPKLGRSVLGAALAAPLLAQFAGTASGATAAGTLGTVSEGWVEVRWTPQAEEYLDRFKAVVEAVARRSW